MTHPPSASITVHVAREHNLKSVDVDPHGTLTVVTGVSGSGKSSLAFDTLFREGQRRYLAALSAHARQFLGRQHRPLADRFDGLPPALAVDQKTTVRNPRSTVGTLTEIYDHLRLLYARIGVAPSDPDPREMIGTHTFSFNQPQGACPECKGLAVADAVDPDLLVHDPSRTLRQGALVPTTKSGYIVYSQVTIDVMDEICRAHGFDVDTPWAELSEAQRDVIFYGSDRLEVPFGKHTLESRMRWSGITARPRDTGYYKGLIPTITATLARDRNKNVLRFVRSVPCTACDGTRLGPLARSVTVHGDPISSLVAMPLQALRGHLDGWSFDGASRAVATPILAAIDARLELLLELGLGHLELGRASTSLSGGEAQRIRLAGQVGSGLHGILYVLDEPSIGLHATETDALLGVLRRLRDIGNTVLCVEHDGATIAAADHLIDLGPGAGSAGGHVLFQGALAKSEAAAAASPTIAWLRAPRDRTPRDRTRQRAHLDEPQHELEEDMIIRGASAHNLRDIDTTFRLGAFNVVTGVSGAGKSTLVDHTLARALRRALHGATAIPGKHRDIQGARHIAKVVHVDQAPIGRTPRSNPATYTGVFDPIRALFAAQDAAIAGGLGKGHFSMNVAGGRCEECQGAGQLVIGMHGLADVEVPCPQCGGRRFDAATLTVTYRDHNIADVLALPVDAARELFAAEEPIVRVLDALHILGLGYIELGQSATTFSGGEAQRIKLATELARRQAPGKTGRRQTLYILDEPTTGLHAYDTAMLVRALDDLVQNGHTVLVIEHDLEIIEHAHHVVDLGPGSGADGGTVVFAGTPDDLATCPASPTGRALAAFRRGGFPAKAPSRVATGSTRALTIRGARTHNLQGIDVEIPHGGMTVITGVSGSGKTSLAFDTIFAEGRRRFAENLTTQARRHLPHQSAAQFDAIDGLTPTIALGQRHGRPSQRSTVGTMSEILDSYRLLFSRAGTPCDGTPRGESTALPARMFSFNQQEGACPACGGTGVELNCDPAKLVTHPDRSLFDGAMDGHKTGRFYGERDGRYLATLAAVEAELGLDLRPPWSALDDASRRVVMFGTGDREFDVTWRFQRKKRSGEHGFRGKFLGFARYVDEEYERKRHDRRGDAIRPLLTERTCPACDGERLRPESRAVTFCDVTLPALCRKSIADGLEFFRHTVPGRAHATTAAIAAQPRDEILARLQRLADLGLGYLTLDRPAATLSGGEAQRVRIAAHLGTRMANVTYVLDEPTLGLHPRDTERLLASLGDLRTTGTVIVVEHDPQVWAAADHVITLGPGAGPDGGTVIAAGDAASVPPPIVTSLPPRPDAATDAPMVTVHGAHLHNLRGCDATLPTGRLVAVTGVSGSGKSTLAFDVIAASLAAGRPVGCAGIDAPDFHSVLRVADSPIGATPATMPATYLGIFDRIRKQFAATDEARTRTLKPAAFSLTTKNKDGAGRCEECEGRGAVRTAMDFLADVWHPCEACNGRRFGPLSLACTLHGKTIADVLELTVDQAKEFFADDPTIHRTLAPVAELGLGYLRLGQAGNTVSGGEAQRLQLAAELAAQPIRRSSGHRLYALNEPTRGLHANDVARLLPVLRELTERGHTVLVVEHNIDVVHSADWVVDMGPEGGDGGGRVLFCGTPAELRSCRTSATGRYLSA